MQKKYTLPLLLLLVACQSEENITNTINEVSDEIDNVDVVESNSYEIQHQQLLSSTNIERDYREKFKLSGISASIDYATNTLILTNNSPRYLSNPIVKINKDFYRIHSNVSPFEIQQFILVNEDITSVEFVETRPFFNMLMNTYLGVDGNDKFNEPSEYNASQYEHEMRSYKFALNDYDFNLHFAAWLTDYSSDKTRKFVFEDEHECDILDTVVRSGNDSSPVFTKLLSMLTHEPRSAHRLLMHSSNGVATIGSGWLSVRDYRLYQEGQSYPRTTYLHEKMHNHGFGHQGGLTYGLADEVVDYASSGNWDNYYEHEHLAKFVPTAVVHSETDYNLDHVDVTLTFFAQNQLKDDAITRMMLVHSSDVELISVSATQHGYTEELEYSHPHTDGHVVVFESDWQVKVHSLDEQSSGSLSENQVTLRFTRPDANSVVAFFASGDASHSWSLQANTIINIDS